MLDLCLSGRAWSEALLEEAIALDQGRVFLSVVIERLGDLFEPALAEVYRHLFTQVMLKCIPDLVTRLREPTGNSQAPLTTNRVYVLSRITLGADVAVTSVLLDAAKKRYPQAEIVFVGPRKSFELFAADPRLRHQESPYARSGALVDRLRASAGLWFGDGIVLDPDSRLSQLGLISVCPRTNYFLFPSREYGGAGDDRLPDLASKWASESFGVEAGPYIAPAMTANLKADVAVSLGVGENGDKRISGSFERKLLQMLAETGRSVVVDLGGDAEERARVVNALPPGIQTHDGPFASFAALVRQAKLFVGYDSAGGHVASACAVPVISIGKGFASPRMAARWRPLGTVIDGNQSNVLPQIIKALQTLA